MQTTENKIMIAAQDVKAGDTLVTLFNGSHKVHSVATDPKGIIWIAYSVVTRPFRKGEIVTVIRKVEPEVVQANMSAEEISNYILANWSDYDRVPKCVNDAHLEATDNTIATFQESGQESTPGEFYAAYMRNLVFVLTCTEFGTAQACEWFKARGVKY